MKLQINRREEKKGLIFKKPVYHIDVTLQLSSEELALVKKHKWGSDCMAKVEGVDPKRFFQWRVDAMVGARTHTFDAIEHAADFESQVIESARTLKRNLEASAGFVAAGPQEIEL